MARLGVLWRRLAAIRRHCRAPPYPPPPPPRPRLPPLPSPRFQQENEFFPLFPQIWAAGGGGGGILAFSGEGYESRHGCRDPQGLWATSL